jgi:hypothetical protein
MGTSGEASIEVEWVVYDLIKKTEVATLTTGGNAKTETQTGGGQKVIFDAFGVAVRHFLAQMERRWP